MEFVYIPCSTDLLQNLLFAKPVKDIPAVPGIRRFITVFKTASQISRS
jgi:hypothetical protein